MKTNNLYLLFIAATPFIALGLAKIIEKYDKKGKIDKIITAVFGWKIKK